MKTGFIRRIVDSRDELYFPCKEMTPESLEAAVAQKEYLARSFGLYLRREPYTPCALAYMKEIAKEHAVPLKQVLAVRSAYAKKHPIPRGLVNQTQKQIRHYNRTHKNRTH